MVPKEETRRYQGGVLKEKGIEMEKLGKQLTGATAIVAGANLMSNEVRTFFDTLGTIGLVLFGVLMVGAFAYLLIGRVRRQNGEKLELEGEVDAVQGMY